jgi:hypothetical protein
MVVDETDRGSDRTRGSLRHHGGGRIIRLAANLAGGEAPAVPSFVSPHDRFPGVAATDPAEALDAGAGSVICRFDRVGRM